VPAAIELLPYMLLICYLEGTAVAADALLEVLLYFKCDVRKILLALQLWTQGSHTDSTPLPTLNTVDNTLLLPSPPVPFSILERTIGFAEMSARGGARGLQYLLLHPRVTSIDDKVQLAFQYTHMNCDLVFNTYLDIFQQELEHSRHTAAASADSTSKSKNNAEELRVLDMFSDISDYLSSKDVMLSNTNVILLTNCTVTC
jgi:hypothetical protein